MNEPDGRLAQWAIKLQHLDFSIVHCVWAIHLNADGLYCFPSFLYLAHEEDHIYDLLSRPDLWDLENPAVE